MPSKLLFTVLVLTSTLLGEPLPQRPRIYLHGLGVSCKEEPVDIIDPTNSHHEDLFSKKICVETGGGWRTAVHSLQYQAQTGCNKLKAILFKEKKIHPSFRFGFHLIGLSQGGLVARLIYRDCPEIVPYIATLTFNGSPILGITAFPSLKIEDFKGQVRLISISQALVNMIQKWCQYFQKNRKTAPLQYLGNIKKVKDSKGQVTENVVYAKLIQELIDDKKTDFSNLERLNAILYKSENVISPRSSTGLGVDFLPNGQWQDFSESPLYSKYGLDKLWKDQRLILAATSGMHVDPANSSKDEIEFLTTDTCSSTTTLTENSQIRAEYKACLKQLLLEREWIPLDVQLYSTSQSKSVTLYTLRGDWAAFSLKKFEENIKRISQEAELKSKNSGQALVKQDSRENFEEADMNEAGALGALDVRAAELRRAMVPEDPFFKNRLTFQRPTAQWDEKSGMFNDWGDESNCDDIDERNECNGVDDSSLAQRVKI